MDQLLCVDQCLYGSMTVCGSVTACVSLFECESVSGYGSATVFWSVFLSMFIISCLVCGFCRLEINVYFKYFSQYI